MGEVKYIQLVHAPPTSSSTVSLDMISPYGLGLTRTVLGKPTNPNCCINRL
jgi:hypothetical protein